MDDFSIFFPCFGGEVAFGGTDFAEPLPTSESPESPEPELLEGAWEMMEILWDPWCCHIWCAMDTINIPQSC